LHGRRRLPGHWAGEPILSRGPLGLIEHFQAWLAEVGALIAWARGGEGGEVAVGGISLGALTSQLLASVAVNWPRAVRPDALLLIATSGDLDEIGTSGSLVRALGLPPLYEQAGWDLERRLQWLPLLEPQGMPVVPPEKIVMLLGAADDLTPFPGGLALARRWGLPKANLFVRHQGHFSVSLGLSGAGAPARRLAEILGLRLAA